MDNKEFSLGISRRTKERMARMVLLVMTVSSLIAACKDQGVPCDNVASGADYQAEYDRLIDEEKMTPEEATFELLDCSSSELIYDGDAKEFLPTPEGGSNFANEQELREFLNEPLPTPGS